MPLRKNPGPRPTGRRPRPCPATGGTRATPSHRQIACSWQLHPRSAAISGQALTVGRSHNARHAGAAAFASTAGGGPCARAAGRQPLCPRPDQVTLQGLRGLTPPSGVAAAIRPLPPRMPGRRATLRARHIPPPSPSVRRGQRRPSVQRGSTTTLRRMINEPSARVAFGSVQRWISVVPCLARGVPHRGDDRAACGPKRTSPGGSKPGVAAPAARAARPADLCRRFGEPGPELDIDLYPSRPTGRATSRADYCAIVPLDLRTSGPPTLMHMDGHRGPAPWSLPPESCCTTGNRTRQTGAYTPPDQITLTATSAWTC
jgi:hypothetical protein